PVSAADTLYLRASSATIGLTTARFPFSECTSPNSTSNTAQPNTTSPPLSERRQTSGAKSGMSRPRAWMGLAAERRRSAAGCERDETSRMQRLRPRLLLELVCLDHVVNLDVVVRPETDTALVTITNLGRVVLEPLERVDREVVCDDD